MRASVIVRSKDEADRLRLTLKSLAHQTEPAEVVVVNDGSRDETDRIIKEAATCVSLRAVRNHDAMGRSAAANIGAAHASGDVLIFLDGDTLAAPDFVAKHLSLHRGGAKVVARGETRHLRCTRFFSDPATGSPRPGEEDRVAAISPSELARMKVTDHDVDEDFPSVHRRSQPGVYPGAGPRRLFELEMDALRRHPDCSVLWAAASGSNQSVRRKVFLECGGFHEGITINEHRELALRLTQVGGRMVPADGAYSYHLTHRSGWRDPATDETWENLFYSAHPISAVPLLSVFWSSLAEPTPIPAPAQIKSLPELALAASRCSDVRGTDEVRNAHFKIAAGDQGS